MISLDMLNLSGDTVGNVALDPKIFGIEPNYFCISEVIKWHISNAHTGTRAVKGRSTVHGTGKKNFRQKGTGSARRGSLTVSQFRGGGVVFGPSPIQRSLKMNKKQRLLALKSVISQKLSENLLKVVSLDSNTVSSTSEAYSLLKKMNLLNCLFVGSGENFQKFSQFVRNIAGCEVVSPTFLGCVKLLSHGPIIFCDTSINEFAERFNV